MTPVVHKYGKGHERTILRCVSSTADPNHGLEDDLRGGRILPAIKAEADRLRVPADGLEGEADDIARNIEALDTKRSLVIDSYVDGAIDKAERDRRLIIFDAERDALASPPDRSDGRCRDPRPDRLVMDARDAERRPAGALGTRRTRAGPDAGPLRLARTGVAGMRAWRDRDYLKCPACNYILAKYERSNVLRIGEGIVEEEYLAWRQGWREQDGRLRYRRVRHGRALDQTLEEPTRRVQQTNLYPDAREAVCPPCGEVVELLTS